MRLSVFDLFKIGIGPSSSHTVGPMLAAYRFVRGLDQGGQRPQAARVQVDLYGSLALTGRGHATDKAILLGLSGEKPDTVDPESVEPIVELIRATGRLRLGGQSPILFREPTDLVFHESESLPGHPNGMRFTAVDASDAVLSQEVYYSIGGGFVVRDGDSTGSGDSRPVPHEFASAAELLAIGQRTGLAIADIVAVNEASRRPAAETDAGLDRIWAVMCGCIERGCRTDGVLPGVPWSSVRLPPPSWPGDLHVAGPRTIRWHVSTGSACSRWPSTRRTPPAARS